MRLHPVLLGSAATLAVLAAGVAAAGPPAAAAARDRSAAAASARTAAASDNTTAAERHRMDSLPTPKLDWYPCRFSGLPDGQCDTVRVPLDYDHPRRASTEIALFKVPAGHPRSRIGTLFLGPDVAGSGALGTAATFAFDPVWGWLSPAVRDRFDLVVADPRGTGFSDNADCFRTEREQLAALKGIPTDAPPVSAAERNAYLASARALGQACKTTGNALVGHTSTAQTARDLELLRRAVGDKQLSYLGLGYGSVIGQYYANMFPDRVRSLVLDSVFDPVAWTGGGAAGGRPLYDRLGVVDSRHEAFRELLVRCGAAGPAKCEMAVGGGDPVAKYDSMIKKLKAGPITLPPADDLPATTFTYRDWLFIANYGMGDGATGGTVLVDLAAELYTAGEAGGAATPARVDRAKHAAAETYARLRSRSAATPPAGFSYDNGVEADAATVCTDGRYPTKVGRWPALITDLGKRAPDFAPYAWNHAQCAGDAWPIRDTSAYLGPFNRRTASPVLLLGARHSWTADYRAARSVARMLPGSRLLTSENWGLEALGSSACVTAAVDAYLIRRALPPAGTVCTGRDQPYADPAPIG